MNRSNIIWLAVVLFFVLCVSCILIHTGRIEAKRARRATAALKQAGTAGIDVAVCGKNATLSDEAGSTSMVDNAAGLVRSVPRVRSVMKNVDLKKPPVESARTIGQKNRELFDRRALSIKTCLIENGLGAARCTVAGLGESKPVADNHSKAGMAKNRRVEFILIEEDEL